MHALLKEPEVATNLLEFILDTPGGRRSVSRVARTCKALSEPALNVLWKELDSITPLLGLMPNHLFKRPRRPGLGFLKTPDLADWKKVIAYGQRVRKITYNEAAGNVHGSIFTIIEEYKPQEYILPLLESLVWKVETVEGLERSPLFLSPSLLQVVVELGSAIPQDDLVQFLTEIDTYNKLTSISITTPTKLPGYLPRVLKSQVDLQRVSLMAPGALSPTIGQWLASLPTLKSLKMDVSDRSEGVVAAFFGASPTSGMSSPDFVMTPDGRASPGPTGADSMVFVNLPSQSDNFKTLRHLSLNGEIGSVSNFIARITAPINTVELALDEPEEAKDWQALWSTLSRQLRKTLHVLQITASGNSRFNDLVRSTSRGDNSARRLSLETMESLPVLTRLEIDLPESKVILDKDLERLSQTCPELQVLKLSPLSRWPSHYGPPKATLAGLAPLTSRCKSLHSISMPFHAIGSTDPAPFDKSASSNALSTLHVGHAWVDDAFHVSLLLSNLAPRLEILRWFHERNRPGYIEAHDVGWQRVSEVLPHLQRLRMQERARVVDVPVANRSSKRAPPPPPPKETIVIVEKSAPKVERVDRGVQVKSTSTSIGVQAKVTVRHKNISTKPYQKTAGIDATPATVDEGIEASVQTTDEAIDASPSVVSTAIETDPMVEPPPPFSTTPDQDLIDFNEKMEKIGGFPEGKEIDTFTEGYMGRTAGYVARAIRAVSPPVVLRLMDMPSIPSSPEPDHVSRVPMNRAILVLGGAVAVVCTIWLPNRSLST